MNSQRTLADYVAKRHIIAMMLDLDRWDPAAGVSLSNPLLAESAEINHGSAAKSVITEFAIKFEAR